MTLGWLRSQALRPFYEADPGSAGAGAGGAGAGAGEGSQASGSTAGAGDTTQTQAQAAAGSASASDLDALKRELAEARREAAKYRTERKAADEKALAEAGNFKTLYEQTQAELKQLREDAATRERQDLLRKVAKEAGLGDDLVDRLRGETEAELLADAKALAKRMATPPPSTGATNPAARRGDLSEDEQIDKIFSGKGQRKSGMRW